MDTYKISELNKRIVLANNPKLVDSKEVPINNIIYHLYNNGRITSQKGGWAYGCLGEITDYKYRIINGANNIFRFPNQAKDGTSYVILTTCQCIDFYKEIKDCF